MRRVQAFVIVCFLAVSFSGNAFELKDLTGLLFEESASGVEAQLKEAKFEFDAYAAILRDAELANKSHISVARNRDSVLIAGQVRTERLAEKAQKIVLGVAHVKWSVGDLVQVEPANAQVCGKSAAKVSGNDKRKFNLKSAPDCSTVNRVYNQLTVATPMGKVQQSDDDLLRATIVNKLLHASIIESPAVLKVVVSGGVVYLLGDQLDKTLAEHVLSFVRGVLGVEKVIPLFRF